MKKINDSILATSEEYVSRAKAAYYRSGGILSPNQSFITCNELKLYVVLKEYDETLAVYRIENCGRLKRLKRWPVAVSNAFVPIKRKATEAEVLGRVAENLTSGRISGVIHSTPSA